MAGDGGEESPRALEPLSPPVAFGLCSHGKRLQPRPPRTAPLAPELRRQLLPGFVAQAAASLPPHVWQAICRHVNIQPSGPITITMGTACSGSEFYLTALPFLEQEISQRLQRLVRFDHRWSCEIDPRKRQWIMDNFAPPKLFADLTQLASGPCHDYVGGALADVEAVDILIAGTSCKDASRLNLHHTTRLNVVEAGAHTTGGTFQGFARLVAKFGPRCRMVYLENVASLRDRDPNTGRSNFDAVADAVRALGFGFVYGEFSARDSGLPIARPRLYMAGVRCADEASAQQCTADVLQSIFRGARHVPLDALLLRDGDPLLMMRDWMREGLARQNWQTVHEGEDMWHQKHKKAWQEIPPGVAHLIAPRFEDNPWLRTLPARSRDLLLLSACRHHVAHQTPLCIPLHCSVNCFTTGPRKLLAHVGAFGCILARGAGADVAWCGGHQVAGMRPESAFLADLAGNAFCVYQFCAWLLATGNLAGLPAPR